MKEGIVGHIFIILQLFKLKHVQLSPSYEETKAAYYNVPPDCSFTILLALVKGGERERGDGLSGSDLVTIWETY